jgi:hypothetical protein
MHPKPAGTGPAPLSPVEEAKIRETLDRVLASQAFRKSEQCQKFLRYVVEHRGCPVKERNIGVEVFNRTPDYDTAEDPIVRVRATEVRKRLAQYYGEAADPRDVRFEIPSGAYHVEIHWPAPMPRRSRARWPVILALFGIIGAILLMRREPAALDRFWAPAISSAGPVLIYCGQPVV